MANPKQAIAITLINEDGVNQKWFYQSPQEAIRGGDPGGENGSWELLGQSVPWR